ncbi:hypothetical protein POX_g09369 [Penicillium oxalicum]|uniref:hypothetical protein n=1 Tax=Penicillium oxalicum TaxID=69781 RepID=UPI0020B6FF52|nr:hypothetical protein POX_g09369 [Penicillium oxalicum]KAI2786972.1 hypothetical protein POX_g09369 [Penicillium oxalicum]
MRAGDPIESTISATQTVLRKINPSYELFMCANQHTPLNNDPSAAVSAALGNPGSQPIDWLSANPMSFQSPFINKNSEIPMPQWNSQDLEGPETGRSAGSTEDLLDFTQSDMGWNLDFLTMDLETFFSTYDHLSG